MKIIGHRGAAGLAPENTIAAIKAGIKAGVDGVEFDIRVTKDSQVVLMHDSSLKRTCGVDKKVSELTLKEIQKITTKEEEPIATLTEALSAAGDTKVYIEGKGSGWAKPVSEIVKDHPQKRKYTVISYNFSELFTFGKYCPGVPLLAVQAHNPMEALNGARLYGFEGIDLNYWILNPLVYWLAIHRHKFRVVVFTVNKPWIASFLRVFYPKISITTNFPHQMQFLRARRLRVKSNRGKR